MRYQNSRCLLAVSSRAFYLILYQSKLPFCAFNCELPRTASRPLCVGLDVTTLPQYSWTTHCLSCSTTYYSNLVRRAIAKTVQSSSPPADGCSQTPSNGLPSLTSAGQSLFVYGDHVDDIGLRVLVCNTSLFVWLHVNAYFDLDFNETLETMLKYARAILRHLTTQSCSNGYYEAVDIT